jgi:rhodanese-related sulfurtransferase
MRRSTVLIAVLAVALAGAVPRALRAEENAAAWEAAATHLANLPQGFGGIKGETLKAKLDAGETVFLLDVREPSEFAAGHIEGSVNVPVREVPKNLDKLPSGASRRNQKRAEFAESDLSRSSGLCAARGCSGGCISSACVVGPRPR